MNTMISMNQKAKLSLLVIIILFIVNDRMWGQGTSLGDWLKLWGSTQQCFILKLLNPLVKADNPMKVGGTFVSYEIAGNTITFMVDRALSKEYPNKGYGIA